MRAEALELLGLKEQDWGPCYGDQFTHAEFAAQWRGAVPCPAAADIAAIMPAVIDKKSNDAIDKQIVDLESTVTARRIREAILTGDKTFIAGIDAQIATLRAARK